jgi:hypothetical protein
VKFLAATAFAACVIAFAIAPSVCNAQAALIAPEHRMIIPPVEYDHPYTGDMWILRGDHEQMLRLCPLPKNPRNYISGCARLVGNTCYVVVADDDILKRVGELSSRTSA